MTRNGDVVVNRGSQSVSLVHLLPLLILFVNSAIGFGFPDVDGSFSDRVTDLALERDASQLIIRGSAYLMALIICMKNYDSFIRDIVHRWVFLMLALYVITSMMWSLYPVKVLITWGHFVGISLSALVASRYFVRHPNLLVSSLSYGLGIAMAYSAAVSLLLPDIGMSGDRWQGGIGNPNTLGAICLVSIWASIANVVMSERWMEKAASLGCLAISVITLYFSGSKTSAIAAIFVVLGMSVLLSMRGHRLIKKISIGVVWLWLLMTLFAGLWLFVPELLGINDFLDAMGRDATLTGRTYIWDDAISLIAARPILGWGFDQLMSANEYVEVEHTHFHNGYLDLLVRGGFLGLTLTLVMVVVAIRSIIKFGSIYSRLSVSLAMLILAILLHNMTEVSLMRNSTFLWMVFMMVYFFSGYLVRYSGYKARKGQRNDASVRASQRIAGREQTTGE